MTSHPHQWHNPLVDPIRSDIMRAVRRAHTGPEIRVRQMLHALGLRFRLHRKDLAGTPDIVLPKHRTVIFVNGCFWHRHKGCAKATTPKVRQEFWNKKFEDNIKRDLRNEAALRRDGWTVLKLWQCEIENTDELCNKLIAHFRMFKMGSHYKNPRVADVQAKGA
jgi:DNA mismatch endonuclease (patch repair protein)